MLRISKETKLSPTDVIERASRFFGEGGEGLEEKERTPCCISFEGIGGYIFVSIDESQKFKTVDVETREFEYQAQRFLTKL